MKSDLLAVPGATLYYEVRGAGPVLLLICGGVYDAAGYTELAQRLADDHTVVTFDRRGNSRSPLDGPPEPQRIAVHAEDARRVLVAVGVTPEEPALVFGNSSGAMIGLELAGRHPELVAALVAHEPPVFAWLPTHEFWADLLTRVEETFRTQGPGPAGALFSSGFAPAPDAEPAQERVPGGGYLDEDPQTMEMMARMGKNMEFFIGYEVPPFGRYVPDVAALQAGGVRIVSAVGAESVGEPPHEAGVALAERLGVAAEYVPGDHGGFGNQTDAFAVRLRGLLHIGP